MNTIISSLDTLDISDTSDTSSVNIIPSRRIKSRKEDTSRTETKMMNVEIFISGAPNRIIKTKTAMPPMLRLPKTAMPPMLRLPSSTKERSRKRIRTRELLELERPRKRMRTE